MTVKGYMSLYKVIEKPIFYDFIYLFREKGSEGKREGEKHQLVDPHMPPTRDLAYNPGMYPEWESNQ